MNLTIDDIYLIETVTVQLYCQDCNEVHSTVRMLVGDKAPTNLGCNYCGELLMAFTIEGSYRVDLEIE